MTRSSLAFLASLCLLMTGAASGQSQVSTEPTADNTPTIESRLRDLEYPELRKRSAEEIKVYRELADITEATFKRAEALSRTGSRGGEPEKRELAGLNAELAKAELAWAEGRVEDAYVHTYRAVRHGNICVEAVAAAYDQGTITMDCLLDVQTRWAKTRLQLIRAEKVAKAAGVDLTEAKRREADLQKKN